MYIKLLECPHCSQCLDSDIVNYSQNHIRWCKKNPNNLELPKTVKYCAECGTGFFDRNKSIYCCNVCARKIRSRPDLIKRISNGRKKYLKNNPDKHPWKNANKHKSVPCEKVKDFLKRKSIKFVEEWQPLDDRFFSIDIAFPDIKLGLEINGNQHYNADGTLKEYYQNRHNLIVAAGWTILEIHYSDAYDEDKLEKIITIGEQPDYTEYFEAKIKPRKILWSERYQSSVAQSIQLLIKSDIDFSKFGWVKKASEILKIEPQGVNRWIKKNMAEFYENRCFKRNTAPVPERSSKA